MISNHFWYPLVSLIAFLFEGEFPLLGSGWHYLWSLRYWLEFLNGLGFWLNWVRKLIWWHFLGYHVIHIRPELLVVSWDVLDGAFRCPMPLLPTVITIAVLFSLRNGGSILSRFLEIGRFLVPSVWSSFLIVCIGSFVWGSCFLFLLIRAIWSVMPRVLTCEANSSFLRFLGSSNFLLLSFFLQIF